MAAFDFSIHGVLRGFQNVDAFCRIVAKRHSDRFLDPIAKRYTLS
jgi:hypothetical protein